MSTLGSFVLSENLHFINFWTYNTDMVKFLKTMQTQESLYCLMVWKEFFCVITSVQVFQICPLRHNETHSPAHVTDVVKSYLRQRHVSFIFHISVIVLMFSPSLILLYWILVMVGKNIPKGQAQKQVQQEEKPDHTEGQNFQVVMKGFSQVLEENERLSSRAF